MSRLLCPCEERELILEEPSLGLPLTAPIQVCLLVSGGGSSLVEHIKALRLGGLAIMEVENANVTAALCNVLVRLESVSAAPVSNLCPGTCFPVPELSLPLEWFSASSRLTTNAASMYQAVANHKEHPVLCSLEMKQLLQLVSGSGSGSVSLGDVLQEVVWRRLMECREKKYWRASYEQHLAAHLRAHRSAGGAPTRRHHGVGGHNASASVTLTADAFTAAQPSRRRVESVVVWVGSEATMPLIRTQARMLQGQDTAGSKAVVGWAATDALYACRPDSTWCAEGAKGNARYKFLPASAMNYMSEGWRCAQRRPLRALAHVLLLFDPLFLVLVDDDTFVNYPLLAARYASFIRSNMTTRPMVMGELLGRLGDHGHLSKGGIFAGGSGYILGRRLLKNLVSREITYFGGQGMGWTGAVGGRERYLVDFSDHYRSHEQVKMLTLLADGYERSKRLCPSVGPSQGEAGEGLSCIQSLDPTLRGLSHLRREAGTAKNTNRLNSSSASASASGSAHGADPAPASASASQQPPRLHPKMDLVLPLAVRLVDFCVNLMAHENTCHHSDHSVGRCLVYGAAAAPINVVCASSGPVEEAPRDVRHPPAVPLEANVKHVMLGMCFMTPKCDPRLHTTCHRYKPSSSAAVLSDPSRLSQLSRILEEAPGAELGAFLAGVPDRISSKSGHYKVTSSVYNATQNMADSFGR